MSGDDDEKLIATECKLGQPLAQDLISVLNHDPVPILEAGTLVGVSLDDDLTSFILGKIADINTDISLYRRSYSVDFGEESKENIWSWNIYSMKNDLSPYTVDSSQIKKEMEELGEQVKLDDEAAADDWFPNKLRSRLKRMEKRFLLYSAFSQNPDHDETDANSDCTRDIRKSAEQWMRRNKQKHGFFSYEKSIPHEARRWFLQASYDLESSQGDIDEFNEWAFFKIEQAAEKALKSVQYTYSLYHTNTHSLMALMNQVQSHTSLRVARYAMELGSLGCHIERTRYPDSVSFTPHETYCDKTEDCSSAYHMKLRPSVKLMHLGLISYQEAFKVQQQCVKSIIAYRQKHRDFDDSLNKLIICQHLPVYTVGCNEPYDNCLKEKLENLGAEFCRSTRGGKITFHGPEQLVVYPILSLHRWVKSARWYVAHLEKLVISVCKEFNLEANADSQIGYTGIWVKGNKICALGLSFHRFVTCHGLALNCCNDLSWFQQISPCGITDRGVTSLSLECNRRIDVQTTLPTLIKCFENIFECKVI